MRRSERLLLAAILVAGAALRVWGLAFGLPHAEARPGETTVVAIATGLLDSGLNPHFFNWPSLEFYVVAAIYRIGLGIGDVSGLYDLTSNVSTSASVHATPFLMVPRVLSVIAGVATLWLLFALIDRLFDRLTAMTGTFFLAVAFLHVRDSHFGVTDVPMTALAVGAVLAAARAANEPARLRRWALCGALAGLAASTKYDGGVVLAAGLATALVAGIQSDRAARWKVLQGSVVLLGTAVIAFLCGTPSAIRHAPEFLQGLRYDFSPLAEGHDVMLGRGWIYHLTFSLWYGLGAPLLVAGLAGLLLLVTSWKKAVTVLTFPVLYYVLVGSGYTVFVRYMIPVVPFLCVTAALFVVWTARQLARERFVPAAAALIAILISVPSVHRSIAFDAVIGRTDTRVLAQQWISSHVGAGEFVGQIPPVLIYPDFGVARPANLATFDLARKAFVSQSDATVSPDWILVATSPLRAYTVSPDQLGSMANRDYVRETGISAGHGPEMPGWFDQQDLFFVPFTTFTMRDRPGPDIEIFHRAK